MAATALAWGATADSQPKKDDIYDEGDSVVEEAREHFNKGVKLNAAGQVEAALGEFQKAYDLVPNWKILYNIGQTSRHQRDYGRSLRAFERYLAEGKDEVAKPRRTEVEKEIQSLKPLVGRIELSVRPPSGELSVDGVKVGKVPLDPFAVTPGRRRVKVTGPDGIATQDVEVPQGSTTHVELVLQAAPVPTASATPSATPTATPTAAPTAPPPPRDYSTHAKIAWAATGLFTLGAAGIGTWALLESNDLKDTAYKGPDRKPPPDSPLKSQASRVDALAWVTDGLIAAAVIGAGAGVYFTFIAGGSSAPPKSAPAKAANGRPSDPVSLRVTPNGAWLSGTF